MIIGHHGDENQQLSMAEGTIGREDDSKYLGSWLKSTMKDFNTRRAIAFKACDSGKCGDQSACVESVLLDGSKICTLTKCLEKRINGFYRRLFRKAREWNNEDLKTLAENMKKFQKLLPK